MWGGYPYGRDEFVRRTGLMRGSRETCIAMRDAKYHWWRDLRDRYIRRYKPTLTFEQLRTLENRVAEKAWCHGHGVHDKFFIVPQGRAWALDQLRYIRGEWLNDWKLGDYDHPDGDYCDMEPNTECSFCGEPYHAGKKSTLTTRIGRYTYKTTVFCSDRCKRADGLLWYGFPKHSRGAKNDVYVPLVVLINSIAKGIQKEDPVAMKILSRRTAGKQNCCA